MYLEKTAQGPVSLEYYGFRAMIKRTLDRHNKRADNLGVPKITKRIHTTCSDIMLRPEMNTDERRRAELSSYSPAGENPA